MTRLGMDVGSVSTVVCSADGEFLYDEPSVLLHQRSGGGGERITIGRAAAELIGRLPPGVTVLRPVQHGVVTDLHTARSYLRAVIRQVLPRPWQRARAQVVVGVPAGASLLEQRALLEAIEEAGISWAVAIEEPIAGALGCGIDPLDRRVHMVVDVGGGTAEASAFCFGGVLASRSCRVGGGEMTQAVIRHVREHHHLILGEIAAEEMTVRAGAVSQDVEVVAHGRDSDTGRPRSVTVMAGGLQAAIAPVVDTLVRALAGCVDDLPAQAIDDLAADGVVMFGGASLVRGIDQALEKVFGVPVKPAENPLTCVAEGAARAARSPAVLTAYGRG
jgi:rod shape-determining protein MreB and related proteins